MRRKMTEKNEQKNRALEETEERFENKLAELGFQTTLEVPIRGDEPKRISRALVILRNPFDFKVDEKNKKVAFCDYKNESLVIFDFDELYKCELLVNNKISQEIGLGSALLGAAVGGLAGAAIASQGLKINKKLESLNLVVYTRNLHNPKYEYFTGGFSNVKVTPENSHVVFYDKVYSIISAIISQNNS